MAGELRRDGSTHHVKPRLGAQMPILRWEPRRPGQLACDVSVNNVLAVANSRLLGQYVQLDERVRPLALSLKAWARGRDINDRSRGTLSSFVLTLMLVHFLQRRKPAVLPSLQDLAVARGHPPVFVRGMDCRYSTDPDEIRSELQRLRGSAEPNEEGVGFLLREFFWYFGYEYERGTIAIRDRSCFVPRDDEERVYLIVDNPFEPGRDVANVEERLYTRLREEFRRAHALVSTGSSFAQVCEPPPLPGQSPLTGFVPRVNLHVGAPPAKGA